MELYKNVYICKPSSSKLYNSEKKLLFVIIYINLNDNSKIFITTV